MLKSQLDYELSTYALRKAEKLCSQYLIGEGWDFNTAGADYVGAGRWTSNGGGWAVDTARGRWAEGGSYNFANTNNAAHLRKTGGNNSATWFVHVAFVQLAALAAAEIGIGFTLEDASTAQCSVYFNRTGDIILYSGAAGGAVLATWSAAFVANSWDSYQFKIVINNTTGSISGRKNGSSVDNFAASGLNTRGGTANNYANGVAIGHSAGTTVARFDDFLCFDNNGAAPGPSDWVGDIRAYPIRPWFDSAVQFTRNSTGSLAFGETGNTSTRTVTANTLEVFCTYPAATQGGKFSSLTFEVSVALVGHMKIAIYRSDGSKSDFLCNNKPGILIAVSNEVTNPGIGVNTANFASDVAVELGYTYSIGILSDANFTMKGGNLVNDFQYPVAYASGPPADLSGIGTGLGAFRRYCIYTTLTATNAGLVNDLSEDGLGTYGSDSTVGDSDLYSVGKLPYDPSSIIGLDFSAMLAKSDAGGRTADVVIKSGATYGNLTGISPATTFGNNAVFKDKDPNTAGAWTRSTVEGALIGAKVAS